MSFSIKGLLSSVPAWWKFVSQTSFSKLSLNKLPPCLNFSVFVLYWIYFAWPHSVFTLFFALCSFLVSGRRGSTASEKKRSKSRARSKSPFRSFRWPKSKARPEAAASAGGSYSDDEDSVNRSTLRKCLLGKMVECLHGLMVYCSDKYVK